LSRLQSGIGTLIIDAVTPADVGDLALGCAYQILPAGPQVAGHVSRTSVVQHAHGPDAAGVDRRDPLILSSHPSGERISVDLRHSRQVQRLLLFAGPVRSLSARLAAHAWRLRWTVRHQRG
jgi:hypothetical protein